eukprot:937104-Rhodomonas_salina.1
MPSLAAVTSQDPWVWNSERVNEALAHARACAELGQSAGEMPKSSFKSGRQDRTASPNDVERDRLSADVDLCMTRLENAILRPISDAGVEHLPAYAGLQTGINRLVDPVLYNW